MSPYKSISRLNLTIPLVDCRIEWRQSAISANRRRVLVRSVWTSRPPEKVYTRAHLSHNRPLLSGTAYYTHYTNTADKPAYFLRLLSTHRRFIDIMKRMPSAFFFHRELIFYLKIIYVQASTLLSLRFSFIL